MAFKRSAVRSRLSPPRDLEREFRVFFFLLRVHDSNVSTFPREETVCTKSHRANFVATVGDVETVISLLSLESWGSLVYVETVLSLLSLESLYAWKP